ncbi:MAG: hypothetical protein AAGD40_00165 [Pseudomonadota bacterium]
MTSIAIAYWIFLAACWIIAARTGYRPALATVTAWSVASIITTVIYETGDETFSGVNGYVVVVDVFAFLFLLFMMMRVDRNWTIYAAALQLNALIIHFAMYVDEAIVPGAYAWGSALWSWIILLVVVIGTIEFTRSQQRLGGPDLPAGGSA